MKPSALEIRRVSAQEETVKRLEAIECQVEEMSKKLDALIQAIEKLEGAKNGSKPAVAKKGEG